MVFKGCMNSTLEQYRKKEKRKSEEKARKRTIRPTRLSIQTLNIYINQLYLFFEYSEYK